MMKNTILIFLLCCGIATTALAEENALQRALAGDHRMAANKARDKYRHPQQTLEFLGVTEGKVVVEIWPGGAGWYTEILAPLLRDNGKLYAAHFAEDSEVHYFRNSLKRFNEKMAARPDVYDQVELTILQPPEQNKIAPDGSADFVLTFRNVHNWMKYGQALNVFEAMFRALKPGGILGVVEHRGIPGREQDPKALSGYVDQDYVVLLARKAGFEFLAKSEINANPKDSRDHPEGVWTLPPSLRLKEQDRDKYLAIGESDRMTFKFIKP